MKYIGGLIFLLIIIIITYLAVRYYTKGDD